MQPSLIHSPNFHLGKSYSLVGLSHKDVHMQILPVNSRELSYLPWLADPWHFAPSTSLGICHWYHHAPNHPDLRSFIALCSCTKSSLGTWGLSASLWRSSSESHRHGLGGEDTSIDGELENSMKSVLMGGTQETVVRNASRRKWQGKNFSHLR